MNVPSGGCMIKKGSKQSAFSRLAPSEYIDMATRCSTADSLVVQGDSMSILPFQNVHMTILSGSIPCLVVPTLIAA